jgi:hypothetical protein
MSPSQHNAQHPPPTNPQYTDTLCREAVAADGGPRA